MTRTRVEPSAAADGWRSEIVPFISTEDTAERDVPVAIARQDSLGSGVEDFLRYRYRKHTFNREGHPIRRHILVRKGNLVGLGKEANRVEDARVLGLSVVGGRARTYVDPDPFEGSATEAARRLGVSRRTVFYRRSRRSSPKTSR